VPSKACPLLVAPSWESMSSMCAGNRTPLNDGGSEDRAPERCAHLTFGCDDRWKARSGDALLADGLAQSTTTSGHSPLSPFDRDGMDTAPSCDSERPATGLGVRRALVCLEW